MKNICLRLVLSFRQIFWIAFLIFRRIKLRASNFATREKLLCDLPSCPWNVSSMMAENFHNLWGLRVWQMTAWVRLDKRNFAMSGNEGITLQSVREFLVKNNGKVKNIDLVHHFRQQLNDPANKSEYKFAELKMDYFYNRWLWFYWLNMTSCRQSTRWIQRNCAHNCYCPNNRCK